MFKLALVILLTASSVVFANEIFKKDAKQFKATVNFEKQKEGAKLILKATPQKGWHINSDFPVSFKPVNTVLQFEKKKYKKKDVKILKETELLFEIPVKVMNSDKILKKELDATVVLGVCTDKICKRVQFKINAPLESSVTLKNKSKKTDIKK